MCVLYHLVMSNSLWSHELEPTRLLCPWDSPGKNTGVSHHALFQGIFPTQGPNPGLPHCRWILYHLSYQGSPGILEWAAYPKIKEKLLNKFEIVISTNVLCSQTETAYYLSFFFSANHVFSFLNLVNIIDIHVLNCLKLILNFLSTHIPSQALVYGNHKWQYTQI